MHLVVAVELVGVDGVAVARPSLGGRGSDWEGGSLRPYPPLSSPLAGGLTAPWVATSPLRSACSNRSAAVGDDVAVAERTLTCSGSSLPSASARRAASRGGSALGHLLEDAFRRELGEAPVAVRLTSGVGGRAPAPGSALRFGARVSQLEDWLPTLVRHGAAQAAQTSTNNTMKLIAV